MQFSIKHLLAVMVLAALAVLFIQQWNRKAQLELKIAEVVEINSNQEFQANFAKQNIPYLKTALSEDPTLPDSVETAEQSLRDLREKHSQLVIADPDSVSTIKLITIGQQEFGWEDYEWRVFVPENQNVYLKFGVKESTRNGFAIEQISPQTKFLGDSAFVPSGPFQTKLESGKRLIQVFWSKVVDSNLFECRITIDGKLVLRSVHNRNPVNGNCAYSDVGTIQRDYNSNKRLPTLVTFKPDIDFTRVEAIEGLTPTPYKFLVWLSREDSEFLPFAESQTANQERP